MYIFVIIYSFELALGNLAQALYTFITQVLQTWHLLCVVAIITGIGVLLILAKTIVQAASDPRLVSDSEHPSGTTVRTQVSTHKVTITTR